MLVIIVFSERVNYSLLQLIAKQITDKNGLKQLSIVHILLQIIYQAVWISGPFCLFVKETLVY